MLNYLEAQKTKVKEEICKAIDEYYDEFSKCTDEADFTINEIEQLMLGQQKKLRETLCEANSELTSGIETDAKKNVLNAKIV